MNIDAKNIVEKSKITTIAPAYNINFVHFYWTSCNIAILLFTLCYVLHNATLCINIHHGVITDCHPMHPDMLR